jgi:rubrerythrin
MGILERVEQLKIGLAVRFGWRRPGRQADAIRGFQATEADGVWHLARGLRRVDDPKQRAILFTHLLEEEAHAEAFSKAYAHYGERPLAPPSYERTDLYGAKEPLWKLLAFVHVGEEDATQRFRLLRDALEEGVLKQTLERVVSDEEGHVGLTHRMLLKMGAKEPEIRGEVRRVRLKRAWEAWLRSGKRVVDLAASLLLGVAYHLVGPFVGGLARRRLARRYVDFDNNRMKRLG